MTPEEYYKNAIVHGEIQSDIRQVLALRELEKIHQALIHRENRTGIKKIFTKNEVKGFYLWGSVGIGKTFLMDCFYQTLPLQKKRRLHFHVFMHGIHEELKKYQGQKNPLILIAKSLAKEIEVLCFDEFHISDITDAMLLGELLKSLFAENICLIATSNTPPDELYKNGLQRQRFLSAIHCLKQHAHVFHLQSQTDYRAQYTDEEGLYFTPLGEKAELALEKIFHRLVGSHVVETNPIWIQQRPIRIKKMARNIIWFDFLDICGVPRSQTDYLEISENFQTVFISNVFIQGPEKNNLTRAWINLIDIFYDAKIKLIISANQLPEALYTDKLLRATFKRTASRLLEMQSQTYFKRRVD